MVGCSAPENDIFVYGTTAYSVANGNAGLDPHVDYQGWSAVRYGVGETLFRYTETMALEPWLATDYEPVDPTTWVVTLKENVTFSNGKALDGQAVVDCVEHLLATHDRAPFDLQIETMEAEGNRVTFHTKTPVPAFLNYLSDPYGAIVCRDGDKLYGTGPYVATSVSDQEISLKSREGYWNGPVLTETVTVKSMINGNTMVMALQTGELDGAQGLPYDSLALFRNEDRFRVEGVDTSRAFFVSTNQQSGPMEDPLVRKAIAMSLDRETFTKVLLKGNGTPATGPFPGQDVTTEPYDLEKAKSLLAQAGYFDRDGDGIVEKDGEPLSLTWLTYPSRQELPLLAELAHSSLGKIGIDLTIQNTANHLDVLKTGKWDLYASAFVTAPTGDPQYFFSTHALENSSKNCGGFYDPAVEECYTRLAETFDPAGRMALGQELSQMLVDSHQFIFVSHLKMSLVTQGNVTGFVPHPCDYYEITQNLAKNGTK